MTGDVGDSKTPRESRGSNYPTWRGTAMSFDIEMQVSLLLCDSLASSLEEQASAVWSGGHGDGKDGAGWMVISHKSHQLIICSPYVAIGKNGEPV
jgi:hypothetical protein